MAGRRVCTNAVAVAMAVALLALLFAAGVAGDCNVDEGKVSDKCKAACIGGEHPPSNECCQALQGSNFDCLCKKYSSYKNSPAFAAYASCAEKIPYKCNIPGARRSC